MEIKTAPHKQNQENDMGRRDFLSAAATGLAAFVFGSSTEGSSRAEMAKSIATATPSTAAPAADLLQGVSAGRAHVIEQFLSDPRVSPGMKEIFKGPEIQTHLDRAAQVFSEVRADGAKQINLREVDERFGAETTQVVAALLQRQMIDAFHGLAKNYQEIVTADFQRALNAGEFKMRPGTEFKFELADIVPSVAELMKDGALNVTIDGDWGKSSSLLREGVQELLLRTKWFEYAKLTNRPMQDYPHQTLIGRQSLAAARWFSPEIAAVQISSDSATPAMVAAEYSQLKSDGRDAAGFGEARCAGRAFAARMSPDGRPLPGFVTSVTDLK